MTFSFRRAFIAAVIVGQVFTADSLTAQSTPRERILINDHWRFTQGDPPSNTVSLLYDVRPQPARRRSAAGSETNAPDPTPTPPAVIKAWILPTGNDFIKDAAHRFVRPDGNPGDGVSFVQSEFDDRSWREIDLPHDWAITGPFSASGSGGMGRLPSAGVGWYRKRLSIPAADAGKSIFLNIDGAMSYSVVWLNGRLVGGWPYGYASWQLDLTPFVKFGEDNQ